MNPTTLQVLHGPNHGSCSVPMIGSAAIFISFFTHERNMASRNGPIRYDM